MKTLTTIFTPGSQVGFWMFDCSLHYHGHWSHVHNALRTCILDLW